ncbi:MAG TPA: 5-methyltetrahydropteroyltriglutamate--homocysteine methyltransferase [Stellaceae bacterium]|nr:5-methyltetrahydropteroyltriglutamate--homocysteine methyltransferase [Stellaceae bacterium]
MTETLLPTTVVGSYPQPDWLIDRDKLTTLPPVRVRASELWRVPERWLEGAQDDATVLAIRDMERAGIDIITDGEIRRESYSNRFATALSGIDLDNPATVPGRSGGSVTVPRIVGPIRRLHPVEVRDVEFLRRNTERTIKITLPGPFTMSRQAKNEFYKDEEELVMDYAAAVNAEVRDLKAAGADVIQLDEPWVQARPEEARRLALPAIDRALQGIPGPTALHLCFGYAYVARNKPSGYSFLPELADTIAEQISIEAAQPNLDLATLDSLGDKTVIFGVISMGDPQPETPETVAARIRRALEHIPPHRLIPAPDCGMKYIPRDTAFAKLKALAEGARIVRRELIGS